MKQFFQIVRGILLAFVLFELLLWIGSKIGLIGSLVGAHPVGAAAVVLLLCLYQTFLRKGKTGKSTPIDRNEYIVTMKPGAYGRIGGVFHKSKYSNLKHLPGGWLAGVRTYRADDGSLLFTVRQNPLLYAFSGLSWGRVVVAAVVTAALLGPLPALSYVNAINTTVGTALRSAGMSVDPHGMSYLNVPEATLSLPFLSKSDSSPSQPESDTADTTDTAEPTQQTQEPTEPQGSADETGSIVSTVGSWISGAGSWVKGFFSSDDYLLPSDSRLLKESDVAGMDASQVQRAINELYARHGYDLSNSADAAYFSQQDWYKPDASVTQDGARAQFSATEEANLDFLITCRSKLKE